MSTAVMPGPNARVETVRTVLHSLDRIAGTLALINPVDVAAVVDREKLALTPQEKRLLDAARAFQAVLNPPEPVSVPPKVKTAAAKRTRPHGQSARG